MLLLLFPHFEKKRWTAIVERNISMPGVLLFSKTYCSFCAKLKALLRDLRIPFRTEVRGAVYRRRGVSLAVCLSAVLFVPSGCLLPLNKRCGAAEGAFFLWLFCFLRTCLCAHEQLKGRKQAGGGAAERSGKVSHVPPSSDLSTFPLLLMAALFRCCARQELDKTQGGAAMQLVLGTRPTSRCRTVSLCAIGRRWLVRPSGGVGRRD